MGDHMASVARSDGRAAKSELHAERHTPGPWAALQYSVGSPSEDRCLISSNCRADGEPIDGTESGPGKNGGFMVAHTLGPQRDANARLIAAAPDLLDVAWSVGFLVSVIKSGEPYTADVRRAAERASDAIAKATARPPLPPQSPGDKARDDHNPKADGEQA